MEKEEFKPWQYDNSFTKLHAGVQSCWDYLWDLGVTVTNKA